MNFSYWEKQFISAEADLVIIGAGITGLSAAYHSSLKHPSWKIIVLEKFPLSNAASTRNAGFSCFGSAGELVDDLNAGEPLKSVLKIVEKRFEGLKMLRQILGDNSIDYEECGGTELFDTSQRDEFDSISRNLDALNSDVKQITNSPHTFSHSEVPADLYNFENAIFNSQEGKLNPGKMMESWKKICSERNITIYRGASAKLDKERKGVYFGNHFIKSNRIVVCTNGLSASLDLNLDVKPARNLVLLTKPLPNIKLDSTYHHQKGYMYFRKIHERILLGGGRHLFKEQESSSEFSINKGLRSFLISYFNDHFNVSETDIDQEWTGIMGVSHSKETIVKQLDDSTYCGVRLGGMGVAIGTKIGKEVSDLIG